MKTKPKLTAKQTATMLKLLEVPITTGDQRTVFLCTCGKVQSHDFIPYALGVGCWRNMCMCNAGNSNWIFRNATVLAEKDSREQPF